MDNRYNSASVKVLILTYENRYSAISCIDRVLGKETEFPENPPRDKSRLIGLLNQMDFVLEG
tara:strand:+ start:734 stop:919 length:186 start_codon:yes stop_codon:yes gene_type:complete